MSLHVYFKESCPNQFSIKKDVYLPFPSIMSIFGTKRGQKTLMDLHTLNPYSVVTALETQCPVDHTFRWWPLSIVLALPYKISKSISSVSFCCIVSKILCLDILLSVRFLQLTRWKHLLFVALYMLFAFYFNHSLYSEYRYHLVIFVWVNRQFVLEAWVPILAFFGKL